MVSASRVVKWSSSRAALVTSWNHGRSRTAPGSSFPASDSSKTRESKAAFVPKALTTVGRDTPAGSATASQDVRMWKPQTCTS